MNPEITRRTVLKGICAAFAVASVSRSISVLMTEIRQKFDYRFEYGSSIEVPTLDLHNVDVRRCLSYLLRNLKIVLPKGIPFEIRAAIPRHYGRFNAIAWYYNPTMAKTEFRNGTWKYDKRNGVMILGRFLT